MPMPNFLFFILQQHYLQKEKKYIYSTLPYLPYLQKYTVHYTNTYKSCTICSYLRVLYILSFFSLISLLLDYSNQGHLTKFSTNLMEKIVNVYSSFPTNYPCNQAVHHKDNRVLVILDNFLENHC